MNIYTLYLAEAEADTEAVACHHMKIKRMWLLVRNSVNLTNMNTDIEHMVNQYTTCLEYQQIQPQERALHCEIPYRPWQIINAEIFMLNNKTHVYCRLLQQVSNCKEG